MVRHFSLGVYILGVLIHFQRLSSLAVSQVPRKSLVFVHDVLVFEHWVGGFRLEVLLHSKLSTLHSHSNTVVVRNGFWFTGKIVVGSIHGLANSLLRLLDFRVRLFCLYDLLLVRVPLRVVDVEFLVVVEEMLRVREEILF